MMGAQCYGECRGNVSFLLTDSRSLCFPEETLFFALRSARNDGQHYIAELYQRGVRRFVVAEVPDRWQANYADATFLVVGDTLAALQQLAARHRQRFAIPVVGITGSNGKTMVKEWLYQTLSKDHVVTRSPRSYNSQVGVPSPFGSLTPRPRWPSSRQVSASQTRCRSSTTSSVPRSACSP